MPYTVAHPTADGMQSQYPANNLYVQGNNAYPPPPNMMYPPPQYNVVFQSQNPTVESGSDMENISFNAGVSETTPSHPTYTADYSAAPPSTQQDD